MKLPKSVLGRAALVAGGGICEEAAIRLGLVAMQACSKGETCTEVPVWLEPSKLAASCTPHWFRECRMVWNVNPCIPKQSDDGEPPVAHPLERRTCKAPKLSKRVQLARQVDAFSVMSYEFGVYAGLLERAPAGEAVARVLGYICKLAIEHARQPGALDGACVVRAWYVLPGQPEPVPSPDCSTAATLEEAHALIPGGCVRMPAMEGDDPAIEEVWI